MAKIVSPPEPKQVKCNSCGATIEYLPEEVIVYRDGYGEGGSRSVKCPRLRCPGVGVISTW